MTSSPLLSVIVPVYHVQEHVKGCINALLDQTYTNLEIIVVDDGSEKDLSGFLKEFIYNKDIKLLHQPHQGAGAARNTGIAAARGEIITFVDSDDLPLPGYGRALVDKMVSTNTDMVIGHYQNTQDVRTYPPAQINWPGQHLLKAYLLGKLPMGIPAKAFRKSFLDNHHIRFPVGVLSEERHFIIRCLTHTQKVSLLPKTIYLRVLNQQSTMANLQPSDLPGLNSLLEMDIRFLLDHQAAPDILLAVYLAHYRVLSHCFRRMGYKNEIPVVSDMANSFMQLLVTMLFKAFLMERSLHIRSLPLSRFLHKMLCQL